MTQLTIFTTVNKQEKTVAELRYKITMSRNIEQAGLNDKTIFKNKFWW